MTQQTINIGTDELAGDGESIRAAFDKINQNFTDVYTNGPFAAGEVFQPSNQFFVDAARTESYIEDGSTYRPFKTIAAAQTAINDLILAGTILPSGQNPVFIIISSNIEEDITLTKGHVFLVSEHGSIHAQIFLYGTITVDGEGLTLDSNHFSIQGLTICPIYDNLNTIHFTGTNPQFLLLQDMGICAGGSLGTGLLMDNSGTGSYCHGTGISMSHTGTGDVYCISVLKGSAEFQNLEPSYLGLEQVGSVANDASLSIYDSTLRSSGDVVMEAYDGGSLTLINCRIFNVNTSSDAYGIWLHDSGCTATLVNCYFSVLASTNNSRAIHGVSGAVINHAGTLFAPNTNRRIDTAISLSTLSSSFVAV